MENGAADGPDCDGHGAALEYGYGGPATSKPERLPARGDRFATTHWSMVVSAGVGRSPEAGRALATLCENYWFPLYAFVRRAGYSAEDAQDLTQEFFARLLAQRFLAKADRQKGKFRSFLLAALKHFLADQWDRAHAQKRGGGQTVISFDSLDAETRYRLEPASRSDAREDVREAMGPVAAGARLVAAPCATWPPRESRRCSRPSRTR